MIIDAHAHLTDKQFKDDILFVLERANEEGIDTILDVATSAKEVKDSWALNSLTDVTIKTIAGPVPQDVLEYTEEDLDFFESLAKEKKIVAVGEIGLDYRPDMLESIKGLQRELCSRFLQVARDHDLPVVIHCREAFSDLLSLLNKYFIDKQGRILPGMLHCFTGSYEEGMRLVQRGWYLSFSGILTFKNRTEDLKKLVKEIPLTQLLVETDCPYLAPVPFRQKRNEPAYITHILRLMAEIRDISFEEMAQVTRQNAKTLFRL